MYEIMRLSGQEYVDQYASVAKELAAKAKDEAKRPEKDSTDELQGQDVSLEEQVQQKRAS
jgi:1-acyl-sn-glycerol-3-phosphate acyltransferase